MMNEPTGTDGVALAPRQKDGSFLSNDLSTRWSKCCSSDDGDDIFLERAVEAALSKSPALSVCTSMHSSIHTMRKPDVSMSARTEGSRTKASRVGERGKTLLFSSDRIDRIDTLRENSRTDRTPSRPLTRRVDPSFTENLKRLGTLLDESLVVSPSVRSTLQSVREDPMSNIKSDIFSFNPSPVTVVNKTTSVDDHERVAPVSPYSDVLVDYPSVLSEAASDVDVDTDTLITSVEVVAQDRSVSLSVISDADVDVHIDAEEEKEEKYQSFRYDDSSDPVMQNRSSRHLYVDQADQSDSRIAAHDEPIGRSVRGGSNGDDDDGRVSAGNGSAALSAVALSRAQERAASLLHEAACERYAATQWAKETRESVEQWVNRQRELVQKQRQVHKRSDDAKLRARRNVDDDRLSAIQARWKNDLDSVRAQHSAIESVLRGVIQDQAVQISRLSDGVSNSVHQQQEQQQQQQQRQQQRHWQYQQRRQYSGEVMTPSPIDRLAMPVSMSPRVRILDPPYKEESPQPKDPPVACSDSSTGTNREMDPPPGDNSTDCVSTYHRSNREIHTFGDGRKVVKYRNGAEKEYYPDGTRTTRFANGDVSTVHYDGSTSYFYSEHQVRLMHCLMVVTEKKQVGLHPVCCSLLVVVLANFH